MMNSVKATLAAASRNLEFIKDCETHLPKGHPIVHVRLDSAGYQAAIFNYCEETGKTFAIGGRLDASTLKAIEAIPESDWKHYADCAIAETTHSMNETHKAFRLIVVKYQRQAELFDDQPKYHVIASNRQVRRRYVGLVPPTWRSLRERHQRAENRLWYGAYAMRTIRGQCRFFSYRRNRS